MELPSSLPHSRSTPAVHRAPPAPHRAPHPGGGSSGASGRPGPSGKMLAVRVLKLDDEVTIFQVQSKALGRVLFEQVCNQLHLLEADYFGLEYEDMNGCKYWLDLEKAMTRQVGLSLVDPYMRFCVKFYTPDPAQLEEEFTRYLFCLQIKRDLARGDIQCNDNTAAVLASYIVQAECGDFVQEDYPDHTYLSSYKFVPHQDAELERRIMENHRKLVGQSPAEADLNLLETARRCELFGMKMHPAKDHEGVPLNLAVAHMGIVVFQNYTKINTFSWAKIRKISFKRKRFLVKLLPEGYGYYKDTVEFLFDGRNECKNFWKKCVEHHGFFRCSQVKTVPRQKTRVLSRGSSFRYSGKTQKQMVEFVRENYIKRQTFQRSQSFRHSSSVHSSVANVGGSISAHPLLPLGDNEVVGTQASLSCGSMTLNSMNETGPEQGEHRRTGQYHTSQSQQHQPRYRTTSLTTSTNTPTHTANMDVDMDTSPECGASLTSSPTTQHYYPRDRAQAQRDGSVAGTATGQAVEEEEDSPFHQQQQQRAEKDVVTPTAPDIPPLPTSDLDFKKDSGKLITNGNNVLDNQSIISQDLKSPSLSPIKPNQDEVDNRNGLAETETNIKKKRHTTDRAYFIAKEMLMTERTYKKDLSVINVWFRDEVEKEDNMPTEVLNTLFSLIDPIYDLHLRILRDVEQRVTTWENCLDVQQQHMGCILLTNMDLILQLYGRYLDEHYSVLESLDYAFRKNTNFEQVYRDFELQKVCYLPLTAFILKPLQRLLHYETLLERLIRHYGTQHSDYQDCLLAKQQLGTILQSVPDLLKSSENLVQLCELQRETVGFDCLVQTNREFLRQGCLLKHSRKGYQQRMFFLFSDVLLYTNRLQYPSLHFKVHGLMPLRGVMVEEAEYKMGANYCFTIYGGNRALTVAASSQEEKDKWLEDLKSAIQNVRDCSEDKLQYLSLKSCSSSDEIIDKCGEMNIDRDKVAPSPQRSNTTVQVCWHRNTSISMSDQLRGVENQLSGFLLRKFKNSNGWQKLWVVFTSFCLFFYKSFQDDSPLASLPLLGYTVSPPSESDGIYKDYVFKLQFKNHVYFFRAESKYTFSRWMEVISSATQHSGRMRLFSRKDSAFERT
ncbi:FERM, ARHGEF and pleckstrin domain-containing protein 2 isoform X2 [Frankliniella occidentalis]|uniref:Moesin/ezrin/radixin homolog 1 n=1 Tax=Frankliniella occidentalis TaxID=133901 RepID=A0A6J1SJ73_FRAOC|nr:FERM, ARHGEF and pleckstrin domain-containing protein 2 isoform X2 [Frankliniella occidentalis]